MKVGNADQKTSDFLKSLVKLDTLNSEQVYICENKHLSFKMRERNELKMLKHQLYTTLTSGFSVKGSRKGGPFLKGVAGSRKFLSVLFVF